MLTRQELTEMQDQEKLLFVKAANMPIQNKRHQEIISLPWFAVQLLDKSCDQSSHSKKLAIWDLF